MRHKGLTVKVGEWIQFFDHECGVIFTARVCRIVVIDIDMYRICFIYIDLKSLCVSSPCGSWPRHVQLLEPCETRASASGGQLPILFDRVLGSVYCSEDEKTARKTVMNYRNFR